MISTFLRRALLGIGVVILVMTISFFAIIIMAPQIIVNNWTATRGLRIISSHLIQMTWEDLNIEIEAESLFQKNFRILWSQPCIQQAEKLRVCMSTIDASGRIDLRPWRWTLPHLGPVYLADVQGALYLPTQKADKVEQSSTDFFQWLRRLETMTLDPIKVTVRRFEVFEGPNLKLVDVNGQLSLTGLNQNIQDSIAISANGEWKKQPFQIKSDLSLADYQTLQRDLRAVMSWQASGNLGDHRFVINAQLDPTENNSRYQELNGTLVYRGKLATVSIKSEGQLRPQSYKGTLNITTRRLADQLVNFDLNPCDLKARWGESIADESSVAFHCIGQTRRSKVQMESIVGIVLPEFFDFRLDGQGRFHQIDDDLVYSGKSKITFDEVQNGAVFAKGALTAEVSKRAEQNQPNYDVTFDVNAGVREFQTLVAQLRETPWAIPTPMNQLTGTGSCQAKGKYKSRADREQFPFDCIVDLKDSQQAVKADVNGELVLLKENQKFKPHLGAKVKLDRLEVVLPEIEVKKGIPKLTTDQRFVLEAKPKPKKVFAEKKVSEKKQNSFSYHIEIQPIGASPILVHTNLLNRPIPLTTELTLDSKQGISGMIGINNYELQLFRREAMVKNLALRLEPGQGNFPIRGLILAENNDYTIRINIYGTVNEPLFVLESEPPLPEKDLYAILLFGKEPEFLANDKVRSVDEARAAIADGAISLLSMYYLASTPIESIGYNPSQGMFTARVNIQEGLSLTLGTNAESTNQVMLQKRLGNNWSIETKAVRDSENNQSRGVAMLKWGLRY